MSTPLDREPTSFTAGDTLSWRRSLPDYPASDGWVLAYRFINATAKFDIEGTADGDDHLIAVTAEDSAEFAAGAYTWQGFVAKDTERHTIGTGMCQVMPDLASMDGNYDSRTPARKALDALNAGLEQFGSNAHVQSYTIEGRSMTYRTFSDFMAARDRLVQEVAREEAAQLAAAGLPGKGRIRVRFG